MPTDDTRNRDKTTVFISSTAIDLPEHRKQVAEAGLRLGFFPDGMENWPAADADARDACLHKVDQADIIIGVYAYRYDWTPKGQKVSITEPKYQGAKDRGFPRLLFVMGRDHPVLPEDVETGPGAEQLKQFKARIEDERVRATFRNPENLRAQVLHELGAPQPDRPPSPRMPTSPCRKWRSIPKRING